MPNKYYAVRIGREGPKIYSNPRDFQMAIRGLSGASGKSFGTYQGAEAWLAGIPIATVSVTQTTTTTTWGVNSDNRRSENPSLTSMRTTVSFQARARPYPEPQRGRFWTEYDSPLNTIQARPENENERTLTPPPPYIPLEGHDVPPEPELPPPLPPQPEIELSEEQKRVLRMVENGKNIFFTGPAGTGKSILLRAIIDSLRRRFGEVAITAPTGIAGVNIGGSTIHSWAGIGLGKEPVEDLIPRLGSYARARWESTFALVIDEISMLDGRLFDKLEEIGRNVRGNNKPFGGIQLVLSGDFFQLPPVPEQDSTTIIPSTFAFDAMSWSRCIDEPISLTKVFRQKDNKFIDMLSAMRLGRLEEWHIQEFVQLSRVIEYPDGISPTLLFPLKSQVESCNRTHLEVLPGEELTYTAMESRGFDMYKRRIPAGVAEQLLEKLVVPKVISLRIGAQVMLLRNQLECKLVNGSLGKVVDFITTHEAMQRHLKIAKIDSPSQGSRDGHPPPIPAAEGERQDLLALNNREFTKKDRFPLIAFTNGVSLLCAPLSFTVEGFKGNTEAQRVQVPLALAWAMSIHKAQGQTMSRVKVDLQRIFERGQAYVALSRATSLEGLEVVGFDPSRVMAHPRVIEWQASWQAHRDQEEEMDMDWAIEQYYSSTDIHMDI